MRTFLVVVSCLLLCACDGATSPSVPLNQEFTLAPGKTATIAGRSLVIRFDKVQGDSRCPADAFCITGGDAIVKISVLARYMMTASYELHTGSMQPVVHDGLIIALVELAPYPFSNRTIPQNEYRATLRVTEGTVGKANSSLTLDPA